jgi:Ca2+-binding RTX toxin-like protein
VRRAVRQLTTLRVNLGDGNDRATNQASLDTAGVQGGITGGPGDDVLNGGAGRDSLTGDEGVDALNGNGGDDFLIDGSTEASTDVVDAVVMRGGDGTDLVSYGAGAAPVVVDLDGIPDDGRPGEADHVQADVERIGGGSGSDSLTGNVGDNVLFGGGGNDLLNGLAGQDGVNGGFGNDGLSGGDGNDLVRGEAGDDTLRGGAGLDTLDGGDGSDACDVGTDGGTQTNCENAVVDPRDPPPIGFVDVTPRHVEAGVGQDQTFTVTWTHPDSWRLLDSVDVRLTASGETIFRARWDEGTDVITQLEGDGVTLDAASSDSEGQNSRKRRLSLVVRFQSIPPVARRLSRPWLPMTLDESRTGRRSERFGSERH